jgi:hypothetical protein
VKLKQASSSFFEKKEPKKLLSTWFRWPSADRSVVETRPKRTKVFCFFFSKKKSLAFLPLAFAS